MKLLKFIAQLLQIVSPSLLIQFVLKLFRTPQRFPAPERENHMIANTIKEQISIPTIKKDIQTYTYGNGKKKALLVHGWSGTGTQLVKIADQLTAIGYTTYSFDAPGHGKSKGKTSSMYEFIHGILTMHNKYGPFDIAIGHSLGGMSILNSLSMGARFKRVCIIGSGDKISDIIIRLFQRLGVNEKYVDRFIKEIEKKYQLNLKDFNGANAAKQVTIPTLVVHDTEDDEIPVSDAKAIRLNLKEGSLYLTNHLGHKKILGDPTVIKNIIEFISH